jgi:hypothetical protein
MYYLKKRYPGKRLGQPNPPGLFIEVKESEWYWSIYKVDMTMEIYNFLVANNLDTTKKATDAGIPIMVQSYAFEPMQRFATMTDLPIV